MQRLVLTIKDDSKSKTLVDLLHELAYVEVEEQETVKVHTHKPNIRKLFGIWKGRDISRETIREKAWKRA